MTAPVIDPNVALRADQIAAMCDADRANDWNDPRDGAFLRASVRVYGDVLPGDDRDDLDVWDES